MDSFRMETPNLVEQNIEKIGVLFPSVITETRGEDGSLRRAVNFDMLRQLLTDEALSGDEAYEFTWPGKKAAIVEASKPIRKTLRPCPEESKNWDTTENLYIEGDNLDVLKLLQESYLGKVKMIYIDPPYNTGHDFIYRDHFAHTQEEENEQIGMFDEETGDQLFENTESNGKFHSDWCSMIYSRLILSRGLLAEDGVILISIDDNEVENLCKMCDEIFGQSSFLARFVWKSRQNKDNRNINGISIDHEYIIAYCKSSGIRVFKGEERSGNGYTNPDNDPKGPWTSANMAGIATESQRPNLHYDLVNPKTGINYGRPKMGWRYDKNTMEKLISEGRIIWPEDENGRPRRKTYLNELQGNNPGFTSIVGKDIYTRNGTLEIDELFEVRYFSFPKPSKLIQEFIYQVTDNDSLILDFFSGSATTAYAVMKQNAEDGGKRKYIMVQIPESTMESSEAYKAGYKNICEIGKERIRRAGEKIKTEAGMAAHDLDVGFRVFKVDESNMKDVYYSAGEYSQQMLAGLVDNIKEERTALDLLFGCLLEWNLPLSLPYSSEQIEGCTVHTYNKGDLVACFDRNVPESVVRIIANRKPLRVVFRDSSFASSPARINVEEIFKLLSPATNVRVL